MIDGHVHVGTWSERFFGLTVDLRGVDETLDACGLDGAVVTSTDLRDNESLFRALDGAQKRYWFFPWVNPADPEDLRRLEAWGDRVNGVKMHPSCDRIRITDPRCEPFLDYAEAHGMPVLVHCGRWQEMASYRFALEAAERRPGVRFILAHMGGDMPSLVRATYEALSGGACPNVFLGTEGIREYRLLRTAVRAVGADRVIWGSDFPIGHPKMYLGLLEALELEPDERDWLTRRSLLRALGEPEHA